MPTDPVGMRAQRLKVGTNVAPRRSVKGQHNRQIVWLALAVAAATAGACANPSESLMPTGPSGLIAVSPAFRPGGPAFGTLEIGARDIGIPARLSAF